MTMVLLCAQCALCSVHVTWLLHLHHPHRIPYLSHAPGRWSRVVGTFACAMQFSTFTRGLTNSDLIPRDQRPSTSRQSRFAIRLNWIFVCRVSEQRIASFVAVEPQFSNCCLGLAAVGTWKRRSVRHHHRWRPVTRCGVVEMSNSSIIVKKSERNVERVLNTKANHVNPSTSSWVSQ